ncbi:MAG: HD-GYP domain-containing protein [Pseudomonadota bacterium]
MTKYFSPEYSVSVDLLQTGVFIRLEDRWFNHPFLFGNFKIKQQKQIDILKSLGITQVICVPEKSDRLPLSSRPAPATGQAEAAPAPAGPDPAQAALTEAMWQAKRERMERLKERRAVIQRTEERFNKSLVQVPNLMKNLMSGSEASVGQAEVVIGEIVETLLDDRDAALHLVNIRSKEESIYYHSLNVAVLALILGRQARLDAPRMRSLGMGALFHDVGKHRIPKKVLKKASPLTKSELALIKLHPRYGTEIVGRCNDFPADAAQVIADHHEALDGQGYPQGLKGGQINELARITSIADVYDNLCNQPVAAKSLTPYQALAYMYSERKGQLDPELLMLFIRVLGVYPPGTIVGLNNQMVGLVIAVNPKNPLKPSLLLYDPDIPKHEALILDLTDDPDLAITESLHPSKLPREIYDYLSPRTRVTYFVEDNLRNPSQT